jgi:GNAT superfamily N-acetyltransferase
MPTRVTITHLELTSPAQLRPKPAPREGLTLARVPVPMPELNRFFYTAVGGDWYWFERLVWNYQRWMEYLDRPELQSWIVSEDGIPAGYFELEKVGDDVEIAYFGLLPRFVERGLGGWLLTEAVEKAWAMGAKRVWLHTCELDHQRALSNYLARGFRVFKTETKIEELPPRSPGAWPGAIA